MQAADIMTTRVVTVTPDATVQEIARTLLDEGISAVPVIDGDGRLRGIVSEGDLVRRVETGTERPRSWWLDLFTARDERVERFVKSHGRLAADVMTRHPITVAPDASLSEVASTLESNRIKRVPVVADGAIVGIISRANLLHGLVAAAPPTTEATPDDRALREAIIHAISEEVGISPSCVNVVVRDGLAQLWGSVQDDMTARAIVIAAETLPGVKAVENRLGRVQAWAYGY